MNEQFGRPRPSTSVLYAASVGAAAAFTVLAALVAVGQLDAVDSFAVRHLMPGLSAYETKTSVLGTLLAYHGHDFHVVPAVKLPASALLSSVIVATACLTLWRRRRHGQALLWVSAFALATAIELVCKSTIKKPALYALSDGRLVHVSGFDSSFPSGHAARGAILVAAVASAWPFLRPLLAVWAVALLLILELDGIHTPSDILGGLLLAGAMVLGVLALDRKFPSALETTQPAPPPIRVDSPRTEPPSVADVAAANDPVEDVAIARAERPAGIAPAPRCDTRLRP